MPFVAIPNAAQVEVRGTLFGQLVENVWHIQTDDPPTIEQLDTAAGIFQVGYADVQLNLSQDYTVREVFVKYLGSASGPETSLFITPPQAGALAVGSEPGNVTFCVSLKTALAGRQFRGRKYIAGLNTGSIVNGLWDPDLAQGVVDGLVSLKSALASAGTPMAVVSKTYQTVALVTQIGFFDLFTDSMSRRLAGHGR